MQLNYSGSNKPTVQPRLHPRVQEALQAVPLLLEQLLVALSLGVVSPVVLRQLQWDPIIPIEHTSAVILYACIISLSSLFLESVFVGYGSSLHYWGFSMTALGLVPSISGLYLA